MLVHQNQTSEVPITEGVAISDRTVDNSVNSGTCHAGVKFGLDGVFSIIQGAGGFSQITGSWLLAGTPADFYVQRTIESGTLQVDAGAGFLQLNVDRIYDSQKVSAGSKKTVVFFEIADDAGGANILDTATMTFLCEQGTL